MSRKLTGKQYEQLWKALLGAYDYNALERTLRFRLDQHLAHITPPGSFEDVVFALIDVAEMEGWTYDLLRVARESRPRNADLVAFANQLGAVPQGVPPKRELERIIQETNSFLDVASWRETLGAIEGRVCRIEIRGKARGTGFLMGPDVVMTNYHVVQPVIQEKYGYKPTDIVLRFDYKRLKDGTEINKGAEYGLITDGNNWLVDSSPYSQVDLEIDPKSADPAADELDYALLRVEGAPGDNPIGSGAEPGAALRGWIDVPEAPHDFETGTPLFIMQHPKGDPLKLALDTNAVLGLYAQNRRVRYNTNTEPGSSGSPVFDQDWNLVALHHSGDPDADLPARYNEGIPIHTILDLLQQRGHDHVLGEQDN